MLQPCQPAASSAAPRGEGTGPQGTPSTPKPQLHPKGPQTISTSLPGSGAVKIGLSSARAPEARSSEGLALPSGAASPQELAGCRGSPRHPRGLRAADHPPAPTPCPAKWRSMGPTSGQELLPWSSPNLCPSSCGAVGVPWEGGNGCLHPRPSPGDAQPPKSRPGLALHHSQSNIPPPHAQPGGTCGAGGRRRQSRAEPSCAARPRRATADTALCSAPAGARHRLRGRFLNPPPILCPPPPRQKLRGHIGRPAGTKIPRPGRVGGSAKGHLPPSPAANPPWSISSIQVGAGGYPTRTPYLGRRLPGGRAG